jgi:hypothetical protein
LNKKEKNSKIKAVTNKGIKNKFNNEGKKVTAGLTTDEA